MAEWSGMEARARVRAIVRACVCTRRAVSRRLYGIRCRRSRPTALDACASLFLFARVRPTLSRGGQNRRVQ